ncbi:MAG TPA: type VII secretion-associated serine protease mycosin [Streptomyces sp.]|nr:type VII secretion-associated serine protease mycosin [Streptomyces sp.]
MVDTKGKKHIAVAASCLGLMLVGVAGTPAHADSVRSQQWHLDAMKADEMWKASTGEGITVAVIDSGVDANLPELNGQILDGKDFTKREGDEQDDFKGHGSGMAAIIAGTGRRPGGDGAFGLAPGAKILPLRVPLGGGKGYATQDERTFSKTVGSALRYAADSDAKVINISLAGYVEGEMRRDMADAVEYALSKDKLIFAGVGNDGDKHNPVLYPAAIPGVVGVAAMDRSGSATKESEHGPQVDLAAPGKEIVSACPGGSELCITSGTSDATALASASAALIWSKYPEWSANQVLRVMINTAGGADSGKDRTDFIGYGAVRPRVALKSPGDPGPADVYPIAGEFPSAAPSSESSEPKGEGEVPQAADEGGGSGDTALWIALGLGAAALLGGGVAASVVVSRRRRAAVSAAQYPVPPMQMPYQPGSAPWPGSGQYPGPAPGQPGQVPGQYPAPHPGATPPPPPPGAPYPYHGGQGPQ